MDPLCQPSIEYRSDPPARPRQYAPIKRSTGMALVLAAALALTAVGVPAQTRPRLADYFTEIPVKVLDASYDARTRALSFTEDLDGDGNQDLIVLGFDHPAYGFTSGVPQPGRVFLGDGNGHFALASAALFPIDTLTTINCAPVFGDFNADGRKDMFLACTGWDMFGGPGEPNRLYLSRPEGGWRDATNTLPQLSDRTNAVSESGDLSGRGLVDIFVANGNQSASRIPSYTLLNTGSGQFIQTSTNIPVRPGQLLDPYTGGGFAGSGLVDLNDDGRPELIVGGTPNSRKPLAIIFWNRDGVFVETDTTVLTAPARFPKTHGEINFAGIDVNQDGLQDLVASGNQNPLDGWYLQIFVNHGNKQFVDETAERMPPGEDSGGTEGADTGAAKAGPSNLFLQVLDFNQDGAPDIFVGFLMSNKGIAITPSQPLLWLNDGTGHFSTLKVGDFVAAGKERASPINVLSTWRLVPTRNGYSFISVQYIGNLGVPLTVTGLLATKPYRITPPALAARN